jgi:hypothetical protein
MQNACDVLERSGNYHYEVGRTARHTTLGSRAEVREGGTRVRQD